MSRHLVGLGRRSGTKAQDDVDTLCYGCRRPFIPEPHTRAGEVLCGACRRGAEPEPVNQYGVVTTLDMVRRATRTRIVSEPIGGDCYNETGQDE